MREPHGLSNAQMNRSDAKNVEKTLPERSGMASIPPAVAENTSRLQGRPSLHYDGACLKSPAKGRLLRNLCRSLCRIGHCSTKLATKVWNRGFWNRSGNGPTCSKAARESSSLHWNCPICPQAAKNFEPQISQITQKRIPICAICAICGSRIMVEVLGCGCAALSSSRLWVFIRLPNALNVSPCSSGVPAATLHSPRPHTHAR